MHFARADPIDQFGFIVLHLRIDQIIKCNKRNGQLVSATEMGEKKIIIENVVTQKTFSMIYSN